MADGLAVRARSKRVMVVDDVPIRRRGVTLALQQAGLDVLEKTSLEQQPSTDQGIEAIVVWVSEDVDLAQTVMSEDARERTVVAIFESSSVYLYRRALALGVFPTCAEESSPEELAHAVRKALEGRVVMPVDVASQLAEGAVADPGLLSADETMWLRLLAEGLTVAVVAKRAGISQREMYRHLHDLYERMGVHTRAEALVRAAQWGVIKLPD